MINRDSRGHLYSNDRGEILGPFEDKLLRKHLPRMFSLIKNESRGSKAIRYRPSSNHKRCQLAICRCLIFWPGRQLPGNQSLWVPGEVWLQS